MSASQHVKQHADLINSIIRRVTALERASTTNFQSTGGTVNGSVVIADGSGVTTTDETGALQIGPSGSNNIGIDGNEMQSRSGGLPEYLQLNRHGGAVLIGPDSGYTAIDGREIQGNLGGIPSSILLNQDGGSVLVGPQRTYTDLSNAASLEADLISARSDHGLYLTAGESNTHLKAAGGMDTPNEQVFIVAEGGATVVSSPDNWASGWAGRREARLLDTNGNTSLPGDLHLEGNARQIRFVHGAGGPYGFDVDGEATLLYRTTPRAWVIEDDAGNDVAEFYPHDGAVNLGSGSGQVTIRTDNLRFSGGEQAMRTLFSSLAKRVVDYGSYTQSASGTGYGQWVGFNGTFAAAPTITATVQSNTYTQLTCHVIERSTTGFRLRFHRGNQMWDGTNPTSLIVHWTAHGYKS